MNGSCDPLQTGSMRPAWGNAGGFFRYAEKAA
jgi:hypothetical protein